MNTKSIGSHIYWNPDLFSSFSVETPANPLQDFADNMDIFVCNTLDVLENIPFEESMKVLNHENCSVSEISRNKVRAFVETCNFIGRILENGTFAINSKRLGILHQMASKGDMIRERGNFRLCPVKIGAYVPPAAPVLPGIWNKEFPLVEQIENIYEKALVGFLWASRLQFFEDCNKRTSFLAANGLLLANGHGHITLPTGKKNDFVHYILQYYDTGNADKIIGYLLECIG